MYAASAARMLSEEAEEGESTLPDVTVPAGLLALVLLLCCYCGFRERVNHIMGCREDSFCGLTSDGDHWVCCTWFTTGRPHATNPPRV